MKGEKIVPTFSFSYFKTTSIKLCNPINITMPIRILIGHVNHVREKKLLHGGREHCI